MKRTSILVPLVLALTLLAGLCSGCNQGFHTVSGLCVACPDGYSNRDSSPSTNDGITGTCGVGEDCCDCDPGNYSSSVSNHICLNCPSGSTATSSASAYCTCAAGSYFTSSTITSATCVSCADGTVTTAASTTTSPTTSCTVCSAGTYSNSAHTSCDTCPSGTTSPGGTAYCNCAAGYYFTTDGSCMACADGYTSVASTTTRKVTVCTTCSAGYYSSSATGRVCLACGAGTYSSSGSGSCTNCPTGSTSTSGSGYCTCPAGYYFATTTTCVVCPDGSVNSASSTTLSPVTTCTICGAGTYSATNQQCYDCPQNTYSAAGAASCTACPTNSYNTGTTNAYCTCDIGNYFTQSAGNLVACMPCADGTMASSSTTQHPVTGCTLCSAGCKSNAATGHTCVACETGTYNTASGLSACIACPSGTTNSGTGNVDCTCAAGKYFDNGACVYCSAGYSSAASTTSSLPQVTSCTQCYPGYESNAGTNYICTACTAVSTYSDATTKQADCYTCPPGTSNAAGGSYCTCPSGSYFDADGSCVPCADGYTSLASTTSAPVTSCTACAVGTESNSANSHQCVTCAADTYNTATTGQAECYPCPGAATSGSGASYCTCPQGYYFDLAGYCVECADGYSTSATSTTTSTITSCGACPLGDESNAITSHLCVQCITPNTYSNLKTTQADCYSCPGASHNSAGGAYCICDAGYYFDAVAADSSGICVACPDGSSTSAASTTDTPTTTCASCSAGYQSNVGTKHLCTACAVGTYNSVAKGQSACYKCLGAAYNSAAGSTSCVCDAGYHFDSTGECVACPDGYTSVQTSTDDTAPTSCTACMVGYQSNSGTGHICVICAQGTYSSTATGQTMCYTCPSGSSNLAAGSTSCACPAGNFFDSANGGNCVACQDGFTSVSSTTDSPVTACTVCPAGYASSVSTGNLCVACGQGTYSAVAGQAACTTCPVYETNSGTANVGCTLPTCAAGNYILPDASCVPCPSGTYQSTAQQTSCVACPTHSTSLAGSTVCTCDSHYYMSAGRLTEGYMEITDSGTGETTCVACGSCPYSYLQSVTLSDEWTKISIVFSASIASPSGIIDGTAALCDYFFASASTALFGSGYTCSLSSGTLIVSLGTEAGFMSTSTLSMNKDALKVPPCTCGYNSPMSVTSVVAFSLSATVDPISVPYTACQTLTLTLGSFSGLGKRPSTLKVGYEAWLGETTVSAYPRTTSFAKSMAKLSAFLRSQTGTSVTFPAFSFLESGQYTLRCKLSNFGSTSTSTFTFTTAAYTAPTLSGLPVMATINEWDKLNLTPLLDYAGCDPANVDIGYTYSWGQSASSTVDYFNDTVLQTLYAAENGILAFPEYTFLPERTYRFVLTVTHTDYPVSLSASVTVNIVRSAVIPSPIIPHSLLPESPGATASSRAPKAWSSMPPPPRIVLYACRYFSR